MAERSRSAERWLFGAAYAGVALLVMLIQMVPLNVTAGRLPGPDVIICLTMAWALRWPHVVPIGLVAVVFLLADVFFMRPIGLHAALVVMAVEFLRAREATTREQTFMAEWVMISIVLAVITATERVVLALFMVDQVAWYLIVVELVATALAYPLVVAASTLIFGVRKLSANEAEARGRS